MEDKIVEKERKIKGLSIAALVVAVLGLTVAFAAMSQTLTINGFAGMQSEEWNIQIRGDVLRLEDSTDRTSETFVARSNLFANGEVTNTNTDKNITLNTTDKSATVNGLQITLEKPGDWHQLYFFAVNYSSIAAVLDSTEIFEPVCTSETGNEADAKLVCDNLVITLYRFDDFNDNNIEEAVGHEIISAKTFEQGNELSSEKDLDLGVFKVKLNENLTELPTSKVTVSNLGFKLNYVQRD